MTGLKGVWDAGDLAIVHAVGMPGTESPSRSHFEATEYWERAPPRMRSTNGWLARHMTIAGVPVACPPSATTVACP